MVVESFGTEPVCWWSCSLLLASSLPFPWPHNAIEVWQWYCTWEWEAWVPLPPDVHRVNPDIVYSDWPLFSVCEIHLAQPVHSVSHIDCKWSTAMVWARNGPICSCLNTWAPAGVAVWWGHRTFRTQRLAGGSTSLRAGFWTFLFSLHFRSILSALICEWRYPLSASYSSQLLPYLSAVMAFPLKTKSRINDFLYKAALGLGICSQQQEWTNTRNKYIWNPL